MEVINYFFDVFFRLCYAILILTLGTMVVVLLVQCYRSLQTKESITLHRLLKVYFIPLLYAFLSTALIYFFENYFVLFQPFEYTPASKLLFIISIIFAWGMAFEIAMRLRILGPPLMEKGAELQKIIQGSSPEGEHNSLARELSWFEGHEKELLKQYEGKYVAIKGEEVICVKDSADDIVKEVYTNGAAIKGRFVKGSEVGGVLIRKITKEPTEEFIFTTREITRNG